MAEPVGVNGAGASADQPIGPAAGAEPKAKRSFFKLGRKQSAGTARRTGPVRALC